MMTYNDVLNATKALGNDAYVWTSKNAIHIVFDDFAGFDDNWDEIDRYFDDPVTVKDFQEMLYDKALSVVYDYHTIYHFDGFDVITSFTSNDI